jgi:hypothetical protein
MADKRWKVVQVVGVLVMLLSMVALVGLSIATGGSLAVQYVSCAGMGLGAIVWGVGRFAGWWSD